MAERIDLKKQGKLKSNITRFRQDKRLAVTGVLYSLALIGMLAIVVFSIFRYHEELNPENLSRLLSYLTSAASTAEPFTEYQFEAGLDTSYAPFGTGLAVSSGDTYSFISGLSDSQYSIQLRYNHPAICTSDKYVLIYDQGGTGFCVANSYAEYLNTACESPILSASMNRQGAFALVTDEEGCRSAVSVYSDKQQLLCKWLSSQYFVLHTSVSPDSSCFAALCLGQNELQLTTRVLYFHIGEEEAVWSAELGEKQVYSMTHDKSGGLVIICDDGVYRFSADGQPAGSIPFALPLQRFSAQECGQLLLTFDHPDRAGRSTDVMLIDNELSLLWRGSFSGVPRAVDCRGGVAGLLMTDRLELVSCRGETPVASRLSHSGAQDIMLDGTGTPILIYPDRAVKVQSVSEDSR